jgi:hypothetical protein
MGVEGLYRYAFARALRAELSWAELEVSQYLGCLWNTAVEAQLSIDRRDKLAF